MSTWDNGYNTDILYTAGYYQELNPLLGRYIFATQNLAFPDMSTGYACELGFGMGLSINIHAAASNVNWYGTDFSPKQVNFAQQLAQDSGVSVKLSDNDFGTFAKRDDLPDFDYICLHGIWSWVSPETQNHIVDFIARRLKVGGVLYISYNVSPGFITFEPVRHLMSQFVTKFTATGSSRKSQLEAEVKYLKDLMALNPAYAAVVPNIAKKTEEVFKHDYHYVVHEYLHQNWDIGHFTDIVNALDRAKLSFACSATGTELLDSINLTPEQQQFLEPFKGSDFYETNRDFIVNQQFRRDFFVKGATKLSYEQREEALNQSYLTLTIPADKYNYTFDSSLGKASFNKEVYQPVVQYFADFKPRSYGQAREALKNNEHLKEQNLAKIVFTLMATGVLQPAVAPSSISTAIKERCQTMNRYLIQGNDSNAVQYLASPVLQGGLFLGDINMRLLKQYLHNEENKVKNTQDNLTDFLLQEIAASGSTLNKEGKPITDKQEQKKLLGETVQDFLEVGMKLYKQHHLF